VRKRYAGGLSQRLEGVKQIGAITLEDHRVNICDGVSGFG